MSAADIEFLTHRATDHWFYGPSPLRYYPDLAPFTYFIQSGETIKIGCSNTPDLRLGQLRRGGKAKRPSAGLSSEARLLTYITGGYEYESELHERFAGSLDRGEWFYITDELTALIEQTITAQASLEVKLHDDWYQRHVGTHGWPAETFDLDALTEKRVRALTTDERWEWLNNPVSECV